MNAPSTANPYETEAAPYLRRVAERFADYKRRALDYLDLRPGEHLLDVGCGAGDDLLALAGATRGSVSLTGIDPEVQSLNVARARAKEAGADIRFVEGELGRLPLEDGAVDVVRVDRVLQHVADAPAAVRELARVVRPGGRVVAVDVDWGSLVMDHPDPERTDALAAFLRDRHVNGRAGRRLSAWLRDAGVTDIEGYADVVRVDEWDLAAYIWALQDGIEGMVASGFWTREEADAWWSRADAHAAAGRFQASMTGFAIRGCTQNP